MGYALENFCTDIHKILSDDQSQSSLEQVAGKLQQLVSNPDFIAATFSDDTPPGKRELWHDPDTDAYVLAHVQKAGKGGHPHSHGKSWAIYSNCKGYTEMTEWLRTNSEDDDHAELEVKEVYCIGPGDTKAYGPGMIHSTAHPEKAWVIRITGGDLDYVPRFRFDPRKDKIP
ncbi:MAG: hypothetical protein VW226_13255 [Rhodospirillaceae bacterium]